MLAAMWLVLVTTCEMHAQDAERIVPVTVRIYNNAGVKLQRLAAAQQVAAAILAGIGVAPEWRDCRTVRGPSARAADACHDQRQSVELIVRIVPAPARWHDPAAFGYSLVDTIVDHGTLSTLFADRIQASAVRLSIDANVLLGRVLAHELGHLLLGTTAHSAEGLMRARWNDGELIRSVARDWAFSLSEQTRMHRNLATRLLPGGEPGVAASRHPGLNIAFAPIDPP